MTVMTHAIAEHTVDVDVDPTGLNQTVLKFRCHGDSSSACHFYPDCDCESWGTDHATEYDHPFVEHEECWMQGWFDIGGACYIGPDGVADLDFGGAPPTSGSGTVSCSFSGDYIEWEWATR